MNVVLCVLTLLKVSSGLPEIVPANSFPQTMEELTSLSKLPLYLLSVVTGRLGTVCVVGILQSPQMVWWLEAVAGSNF